MMKNKKKILNRYINRRQFLIGSGQFMLTLPPLISLMPSQVLAQVQQPKVRVMTFIGVFGIDYHQLYPDDPLTMSKTSDPNINYLNLLQMPKNVSRILDFNDPNLSGLQAKTNLIRGLGLTDGKYAGHNHSVLSGTKSGGRSPIYGESIDVIIARALGVDAIRLKTTGSSTAKANEFSFSRDKSGNRIISPLTFGDHNLFNMLFPGGMTQQTSTTESTQEKSIVDKVLEDLNSLMSHKRISQNDRNVLSNYVDGVNDLQKRIIANSNAPACSVPNMSFASSSGSNKVASANKLYDNYADLIVLAAQCDNARVFHIANTAISDINNDGSHPELHHNATGGSDGAADRQGWFLRRVGRLASKLDQITDPFDSNGKTLLDNSILFWTNEMGAWTTSHATTSIPVVTFGGGGGYFRTGQYMDFRQRPFLSAKNNGIDRHLGRPYKQILISIMRAAGLERSQYINIGDGNGFGEFNPIMSEAANDAKNHYAQFQNDHNDPLPYLSLRS